jgi:hypothetical protein
MDNHGGLFAPGGPQLKTCSEQKRTFGAKVVELGTEFNDPRPDLDKLYHDGALWAQLLALSHKSNPLLSGLLHGFRCQGTRLEKTPKGYVMRPVFGKDYWPSQQAYERDRDHYLMPHKAKVIELLDQLFEWKCPGT